MKLIQDRYFNFYNLGKLIRIRIAHHRLRSNDNEEIFGYEVAANFSDIPDFNVSFSKIFDSIDEATERMEKVIRAIINVRADDCGVLRYGEY